MILCRYDDAAQYLYEIRQGLESEDIPYVGRSGQYRGSTGQADHGAAVYSLYKAKGREAKHVILVHAAEGRYGFPRMNGESELIDPVQPIDIGGLEEERRAFYVAITRSKQTLDILTRNNQESRFIDEIADYTALLKSLENDTNCVRDAESVVSTVYKMSRENKRSGLL